MTIPKFVAQKNTLPFSNPTSNAFLSKMENSFFVKIFVPYLDDLCLVNTIVWKFLITATQCFANLAQHDMRPGTVLTLSSTAQVTKNWFMQKLATFRHWLKHKQNKMHVLHVMCAFLIRFGISWKRNPPGWSCDLLTPQIFFCLQNKKLKICVFLTSKQQQHMRNQSVGVATDQWQKSNNMWFASQLISMLEPFLMHWQCWHKECFCMHQVGHSSAGTLSGS